MNNHDETNEPDQQQDQSNQPMAGATMSEGSKLLNVEDGRKFAILAAQSLKEDKCTDVVVIDVGGRSPVTGFLVIGSGTSARQMRGALAAIEKVAEEFGTSAFHITEDGDAIWLLADFVDVVVHLFEPNARAHYDLEGLWFAGERLDIPEPDQSLKRSAMPGRTVIRKEGDE
tara:strand:- start:4195 stop:4710 length:516 start_codon:yes stop_codon:yes gene_type:complete